MFALFTNAFADHFLTDAFAAGHIRVPRQEIRGWAKEDQLAGALAKLLHDEDGHVNTSHGEGHSLLDRGTEGLQVRNARGDTWYTRCDGQLFIERREQDLAVHLPVEAVRASVKELLLAYLSDDEDLPAGLYEATRYVPFPHPDGLSLCAKFPENIKAEQIERLLKNAKWYTKIPYIGPSLAADHIQALCSALPALLQQFRQGVKDDVEKFRELTQRLPEAFINAFKVIQ
jgi:hypothetical protein